MRKKGEYITKYNRIQCAYHLSQLGRKTSPVDNRIPLLIRTIQPDQSLPKLSVRQGYVLSDEFEIQLSIHVQVTGSGTQF